MRPYLRNGGFRARGNVQLGNALPVEPTCRGERRRWRTQVNIGVRNKARRCIERDRMHLFSALVPNPGPVERFSPAYFGTARLDKRFNFPLERGFKLACIDRFQVSLELLQGRRLATLDCFKRHVRPPFCTVAGIDANALANVREWIVGEFKTEEIEPRTHAGLFGNHARDIVDLIFGCQKRGRRVMATPVTVVVPFAEVDANQRLEHILEILCVF